MLDNSNIAYEKFNLIEVKSEEEGKKYYIEGHISTIDPDSANDIVTEQGQDKLVEEIKTKDITMDLDHESFRNEDGTTPDRDLNKIPVAKITESKRTALGTYVKAMLNKDHPFFQNILSSIKNGFLHSFSIAYHVKEAVKKIISGEEFRLLNNLELRNVGITGNPVNSNATFSVSLKSHIRKMEEKQELSKLEEAIVEIKSAIDSLKESNDAIMTQLKSEPEAEVESEPETTEEPVVEEVKESSEAEVKSLKEENESLKQEVADLKSKLKEPVMTGAVETEFKSQPEEKITSLGFEAYI